MWSDGLPEAKRKRYCHPPHPHLSHNQAPTWCDQAWCGFEVEWYRVIESCVFRELRRSRRRHRGLLPHGQQRPLLRAPARCSHYEGSYSPLVTGLFPLHSHVSGLRMAYFLFNELFDINSWQRWPSGSMSCYYEVDVDHYPSLFKTYRYKHCICSVKLTGSSSRMKTNQYKSKAFGSM
jgi:hypothetical protein